VSESSPWGHTKGVWNPIPGLLDGYMYVIGGNREASVDQSIQDWPSTSEVWRSADGVTWEQLEDAPFNRSMVMDAVTMCGLMFVIGGNSGTANTRIQHSDTWAFNGTSWRLMSEDSRGVWAARDFVSNAAFDDKLWVTTGTVGVIYTGGVKYSRDLGVTWETIAAPPWLGSHADCLSVGNLSMLMAGGNGQGYNVFKVVVG
jgi:hypothetical protein